MPPLPLFLVKSIVTSGLLTAWYVLGLRGRRLHTYNRFFLLIALFASIAIPAVHLRLFELPEHATGGLSFVPVFAWPLHGATAVVSPVPGGWTWMQAAGVAAGAVSLVLLSVVAIRIVSLWRLCRRYPVVKREGANLIVTDAVAAPFAFLKYIVWKAGLPLDDESGRLIFRHELVHVKQGHTWDAIACGVLTSLFWFNPFLWFIRKELRVVHEFAADEQAVADRDPEVFARMLLRSYSGSRYLQPEHRFFASPIKRRLAMLQRAALPSRAASRRWVILPLLATIVLLFSARTRGAIPSTDAFITAPVPVCDATDPETDEAKLVALLERDGLINQLKGFSIAKKQHLLFIDGVQLLDAVAGKYIDAVGKDELWIQVEPILERQKRHPDVRFQQLLLPGLHASPCVDTTLKKPGC